MRRLIALCVLAALADTVAPEPAWAQGNIGGTIGKRSKDITGGEQPAPAKRSETPRRRATATKSAPAGGDSCRSLVGSWTWAFGLATVVFKGDRTTSHTRGHTGKWSCSQGSVVINWNHKVTDRGTLSDNDTKLSIVSTIGISFQATKK